MKISILATSTVFVLALGACSSSPKGDQEPVEAQQLPPNTPAAPHTPEMEETPAIPTETVKEEPAQPIEKKEEPIVVEQKAPEVKPESVIVEEPAPVIPVGKCQFVGHRNVAHDFEIKCSAKILNIVYGRMTVGQSLNIQANGIDLQIAKHDDNNTLEGSVKAEKALMISIVFEDDSRQELEFHGDKVVLK